MKILRTVFFCTLLVFACSIARVPTPFCVSRPMVKELTLSPNELISFDMANLFAGYNLNISLLTKHEMATMTNKFLELDRKNAHLPNLISHYVEHKGNTWGK